MHTLKISFVVGAQWMIWTIGIFLQLVSHKLSSANVWTFVSDFHKLRQDPPWFEFLVIFDFFAPWYRNREASSVKIS